MSSAVATTATTVVRRSGAGARLPPLPTIRDLVRLYRLRAIKQLSQNFLMDERLTDRIVRAAGPLEGAHVLEVGPGPGGITRSIIRQAPAHLVLVEKDPRFVPTLELLRESSAALLRTDLHIDDILRFPIAGAFDAEAATRPWDGPRAPVHLIGNLPFAISTRLLIDWLRDVSRREGAWSYGRASMTLTFQKEVADRIVAPMLGAQRCRLSVMSQLWTYPQLRFEIPGRAFVPKPDVDVGVVTFVPRRRPLAGGLEFGLVERVVRHVFSMRQKFCRRGVANLYPEEQREELTRRTFEEADVDGESRSFQLSNEEMVRLAGAYAGIVRECPEVEGFDYRACRRTVAAARRDGGLVEEEY